MPKKDTGERIYPSTEKRLRGRGTVKKVRTICVKKQGNKCVLYGHVYVTSRPGPRGGHTVVAVHKYRHGYKKAKNAS